MYLNISDEILYQLVYIYYKCKKKIILNNVVIILNNYVCMYVGFGYYQEKLIIIFKLV